LSTIELIPILIEIRTQPVMVYNQTNMNKNTETESLQRWPQRKRTRRTEYEIVWWTWRCIPKPSWYDTATPVLPRPLTRCNTLERPSVCCKHTSQ